jgi:phage terminase Nu1 subunit (DNA packaging protein)
MATMADLRVQASKKRLADLHKKHLAGKISQAEYKEYQQLLEDQDTADQQAAPSHPSGAWMVGNRDLADLLGVSQKTICGWVKLGMPRMGRDQYDFRAVFPWWMDRIYKGPEDKDETITAAKKRYWLGKADQIQLKNSILAGDYVPRASIAQDIADRASIFRSAVRSWRTRLPHKLVGLSSEDMLPIIEAEMDDALQALSDEFARIAANKGAKRCRKSRAKKPTKARKPSSKSRSLT